MAKSLSTPSFNKTFAVVMSNHLTINYNATNNKFTQPTISLLFILFIIILSLFQFPEISLDNDLRNDLRKCNRIFALLKNSSTHLNLLNKFSCLSSPFDTRFPNPNAGKGFRPARKVADGGLGLSRGRV